MNIWINETVKNHLKKVQGSGSAKKEQNSNDEIFRWIFKWSK
nr:hypothetical protein [Mycoplasmopsis bovis]